MSVSSKHSVISAAAYQDYLWHRKATFVHPSDRPAPQVVKAQVSYNGNRLPDETTIAKLESRNKQLLQASKQQNNRTKHFAELEIAIERDYLRRFRIGCRG